MSAFGSFQIQNAELKTIFHCSSSTFHRAAETAVCVVIPIGKLNTLPKDKTHSTTINHSYFDYLFKFSFPWHVNCCADQFHIILSNAWYLTWEASSTHKEFSFWCITKPNLSKHYAKFETWKAGNENKIH